MAELEDHEYDVMSRYPLLSAMSDDFKKWSGFISTATGKTKVVSLIAPNFPRASDIQLDTDNLGEQSVLYWTPLIDKVSSKQCDTVLEYLESLETQVLQGDKRNKDLRTNEQAYSEKSELYPTIIKEIEDIGVNNVCSLTSDFKEIVLKRMDRSGREHKLKIIIPEGYPKTKPTINVELPYPSDSIPWPTGIKEIYHLFLSYVDKTVRFWDDMEDFDSHVRVVEPLEPSKSHFHRRVLLEDNVIMHLILNPVVPRALPLITFSGPEAIVNEFTQALDQNCPDWDENEKVCDNLKSILGCQFVRKETGFGEEEEDQLPCTVCYVYNFEDEIPDITCDCGSAYHRQCLQDLYVNEVATTALRRCVPCPSCQMDIRVPTGFGGTSW